MHITFLSFFKQQNWAPELPTQEQKPPKLSSTVAPHCTNPFHKFDNQSLVDKGLSSRLLLSKRIFL